MRAWEWGALLVILTVAGFLRLQQPGVVEYRRDEANLSRLALEMARGESVPLLGIGSSIGVPNPPFSVWVFALPYALFGNDPVRVTQFVAVLGLLAVLLLFLFARRWWGPATAVVAALLFATNPWAVIWSRKIWAQDVIPFFVLLTLGVGVLGFLEKRRWAQALFLPLLSVTGQIYYATFVLVPAAAYLVWAGRKHLGRPFWIGVGVTVLSVVPFAVGAAKAWGELPAGVAEAHLEERAAEHEAALSADVLLRLRDTWGGSGARDFVGGEVGERVLDSAPDGEGVFLAVGVLALLACAWVVVWACRRGAAPLDRMIALWVIVTPLVYAVTWTTVWIHYMIPALPAGFLALGILVGRLRARPALALGMLVLIGLSGLHVWSQTSMLGFVGRYTTPGGFGVPLGMRMAVRDEVLARVPRRAVVVAEGDDVIEDSEAAIWDVLLSGAKDVSIVPYTLRLMPAGQHIVLDVPLGCDGAATFKMRAVHGIAGPPRYVETCYQVRTQSPSEHPQQGLTVTDTSTFACGARVTAFRWDEATDTLELRWHVEGPHEGLFFVECRLLDATGRERARLEGRLPRGRHWRSGDLLGCIAMLPREQLPGGPAIDPRTIEIRLFRRLKRTGLEEHHGVGLKDDPSKTEVVLEIP